METKAICTFLNFTITQSTDQGKPSYQIWNREGELYSGNHDSLYEPLRIMRDIERLVKEGEIFLD